MCSGQHYHGSSTGLAHFHHVALQPHPGLIPFGGDLLLLRQGRFSLAQIQHYISGLDTAYGACDDIAFAVRELLIEDAALGLADALHHYLLGSLRRYSSELLGGDLVFDHIARVVARVDRPGIVQQYLTFGIVQLLHNGFAGKHQHFPSCRVYEDSHVLRRAVVPLERRNKRRLYRIKQHFLGYPPLLL